MDTTGLSTQHLPPPPARRDGADGRTPPAPRPAAAKPAPPSLPPRLPPRGARDSPPPPPSSSAAAAPSQQGDRYLNQGAVARLGAAGVSVPGLAIGRSGPSPPPPGPAVVTGAASSGSGFASQVKGFQNNASTYHTPSGSPAIPASQGTTWAQKQAALKTASDFRKNSGSVSLSDAKAAASTANNFKQRHGHQVEAGIKRVNDLDQKYGVMDKIGARVDSQHQETTSEHSDLPATGKKKPPPPPPKKLRASGQTVDWSV